MNGTLLKLLVGACFVLLPLSGVGLLYVAQLSGLIGIMTPTEETNYDYAGTEHDAKVITKNGGVKK